MTKIAYYTIKLFIISGLYFVMPLAQAMQPSPDLAQIKITNIDPQLIKSALIGIQAPVISTAPGEVTLESSDNQRLTVPRSVAELSITIKHLISDLGTEQPIPIPTATSKQLADIIAILTKIHELGSPKDYGSALTDTLNPLFIGKNLADIIQLLILSNYLDIKVLLDYLGALIAVHLQYDNNLNYIELILKDELTQLPKELQDITKAAIGNLNKKLIDQLISMTAKVLKGHIHEVTSVAFSPNSKFALTGSSDSRAIVWDVNTSTIKHKLESPIGIISSVAFSPNSKFALTGSTDGTAILWGVDTGTIKHTLEGHTNAIYSVVFSPDGKLALTGAGDDTAIVWNVDTGTIKHTFESPTAIYLVAFSPDGKLALTGLGDKTARIWDVDTGEMIQVLEGHTKEISSGAFSSNGKLVLTGSDDNTARLWNVATGETIRVLEGHADWVSSVAFSSDCKLALTGSDDKTAIVWDVNTGTIKHVLKGHTQDISSIAFSPDSKLALTGSYDHTAKIWDLTIINQLSLSQLVALIKAKQLGEPAITANGYLSKILNEIPFNIKEAART